MSDDTTSKGGIGQEDSDNASDAASSSYKVLGEFVDASGTGVLGRNTAGSGTPVGVEGAVPNTSNGFGLSTPDDARIGGSLDGTGTHTLTVDGTRTLELGSPGAGTNGYTAGGNVIGGYADNRVQNSAVGATVGGGGSSDTSNIPGAGSRTNTNEVTADYGTVGGGQNNRAGGWATVAGGGGHTASADFSTVGGGFGNRATKPETTVAGGVGNYVSGPKGTVGGGEYNAVVGQFGTIAGGGPSDTTDPSTKSDTKNRVTDNYGTVGGGGNNQAGDGTSGVTDARFATVGGGRGNLASGTYSTVAGGRNNTASKFTDTVGGGRDNTASGNYSTIGGGKQNTANEFDATVGGGEFNTASGSAATIGGGAYNDANASHATVAGGGSTDGTDSTGNAVYDDYGTVGGGGNNQAGSADGTSNAIYATVAGGRRNRATARSAAVPGGENNEATGVKSFAAGEAAKAEHDGTFVWSNADGTSFSSTGQNQFLVEADGGFGFGTDSPVASFHVVDYTDGQNDVPGAHIGLVEDPSDTDDNSLLALRTGYTGDPGQNTNFLTFFNGNDTPVGSIEGDGGGGVQLDTSAADYAEYMPQADHEEELNPSEVVGVVDGAVTKTTADAEQVLVVSNRPAVTGNSPGQDPDDRAGYEVCAFVGQVPVKIRGPVAAGDLVVPSGEGDGIARAVPPGEFRPRDGPLVGRAWAGSDGDGVSEVTVSVGLETGEALSEVVREQQTTIGEHAARIEDLQAENETLRERLDAVEAHVGMKGPAQTTPADD